MSPRSKNKARGKEGLEGKPLPKNKEDNNCFDYEIDEHWGQIATN